MIIVAITYLTLLAARADAVLFRMFAPEHHHRARQRVVELEQRLGITPTADQVCRRLELRRKAGLYRQEAA